jgi:hypothetical protein
VILFDRLIDDAGLFPPARKPMDRAVADHRAARSGPHAWMLGRLLCPASRLAELAEAGPAPDWRIGVIVDGPVAYDGLGTIDCFEVKALDAVPDGIEAYVEVATGEPRALTAALEDIAADGRAGAKIRCGGLTADLFPSDDAVARFVTECRRLRLTFKATAGLHHPFRTRDEEIGVLQHGFVNLLAATAIPEADTVKIIAETDPGAFDIGPETIGWRGNHGDAAEARASLTAFGSCSFDEPVEDLLAHHLLAHA